MRRVFLLLAVLLLPVIGVQAQSLTFNCETGERYDIQMEFLPPLVNQEIFDQFIVSVIGIDGFQPVIGIDSPGVPFLCSFSLQEMSVYDISLPEIGTISPSLDSAQEYIEFPGQSIIKIGELANRQGEFIILSESLFDASTSDNHRYLLPLTESITESGLIPTVYLFALTPDFEPTLTVLPHREAEPMSGELVEEDIQFGVFEGATERALAVSLEGMNDDVRITVDDNGADGVYALVVHLKTGEPIPGDGIAEVVTNGDGSLLLTCSNGMVSENAFQIDLPDDGDSYTVTVVGLGDVNPILATVDESGQGYCFDNTPEARTYSAFLPTITVDKSVFSGQVVAEGDMHHVVVGVEASDNGEFLIVVEGANVSADNPEDVYGVYITPAMATASFNLTTYVIGTEDTMNPIVAYVDSSGAIINDDTDIPYECNDAGIPDACYGQTAPLTDYFLTIADNQTVQALAVDAVLQVPINETVTGATYPMRVSGHEGSVGMYLVAFHIATD